MSSWTQAPKWANYKARQKGTWYWFEKKPKHDPILGWIGGGRSQVVLDLTEDRNTLEARSK